jgi:hypothetical protein
LQQLQSRQRSLQHKHANNVRDADGEITPEMRDDLMELLQLFGVPYVEAPGEGKCFAQDGLETMCNVV